MVLLLPGSTVRYSSALILSTNAVMEAKARKKWGRGQGRRGENSCPPSYLRPPHCCIPMLLMCSQAHASVEAKYHSLFNFWCHSAVRLQLHSSSSSAFPEAEYKLICLPITVAHHGRQRFYCPSLEMWTELSIYWVSLSQETATVKTPSGGQIHTTLAKH